MSFTLVVIVIDRSVAFIVNTVMRTGVLRTLTLRSTQILRKPESVRDVGRNTL